MPFRRIYVLAVAVQHKHFLTHKYFRGCFALIEVLPFLKLMVPHATLFTCLQSHSLGGHKITLIYTGTPTNQLESIVVQNVTRPLILLPPTYSSFSLLECTIKYCYQNPGLKPGFCIGGQVSCSFTTCAPLKDNLMLFLRLLFYGLWKPQS